MALRSFCMSYDIFEKIDLLIETYFGVSYKDPWEFKHFIKDWFTCQVVFEELLPSGFTFIDLSNYLDNHPKLQ